ncbi:CapA family protein [Terrisporobacter vanillatitrophus]|uniref:CapA family protein n=1 Tax=Terrisporobacter vanillatitrophus TaxID=3058402 RepID=UPI0033671DBA
MSRKKSRKKRKSNNKLFVIIIIVICSMGVFFIYKGFNKDTKESKTNNTIPIFNENVKTYEASILATGDVMVHSPQLQAQYDYSTGTYNFDNNFKYVKKYIENADYSLANLETTLAGNDVYQYSSYPTFNSPDELADALKNAGFDLLSTINNHSFDKRDLGVNRTLSTLKEKGFDTVGTRENSSDKEYIIKDINNIKVGITSYSYGDVKNDNKYLNGIKISEDWENKMNIFDSSDVDKAFETISSTTDKMKDSDIQVVIIHWGIEYARNETDFQKQLAQKLCDDGVDIIIGSHPHVVEPVETITSSDGKNKTLVIYSLGNYISNQRRETVGAYSEDGLMVNIDISKKSNEKEAKVEKVTCIPTWVNKYNNGYKNVYEIVPIEDESDLNSITSLNKYNVKQSYNNTASLIDNSDIITVVDSPFK